jgi:hypothetical protein
VVVAGVPRVALAGLGRLGPRPIAVGAAPYSSTQRLTSGDVSSRSTDEPRNSSTIRRDRRTRSLSVFTAMPFSTFREHAGTSTREFSTSTTQTRQTFTGVRFSR